jgi:hypothetical protein
LNLVKTENFCPSDSDLSSLDSLEIETAGEVSETDLETDDDGDVIVIDPLV